MNLWFFLLPRSGAVYQQRHYAATKRITSSLMVAAMELSPLYRTFQVYKFGNRKYNFLLNYFVVLNVWHGFVFCKIPIGIPLNIETSIPRYFARRYSVRCWYRVPVYRPTEIPWSWEYGKFKNINQNLPPPPPPPPPATNMIVTNPLGHGLYILWCIQFKSNLCVFLITGNLSSCCKCDLLHTIKVIS